MKQIQFRTFPGKSTQNICRINLKKCDNLNAEKFYINKAFSYIYRLQNYIYNTTTILYINSWTNTGHAKIKIKQIIKGKNIIQT